MADGYVSQVQLPNNETYNIKDKELIPRLKATVGHSNKNLLDLKNIKGKTEYGITWTIDEQEGIVTATGTVQSGKTSQLSFVFENIPSGNYYFYGCIGGSDATYDVYCWDYTTSSRPKQWDGTTNIYSDYNLVPRQLKIVDNHEIGITLRIKSGVTVDNLVFKPMVWDASILDDTFEPYEEPTDLRAIKVKQSLNTKKKYYPLLFSSAEYSNSTSDIIDTVGRTNNTFIYPYSGWVYAGGGFCAGTSLSTTGGKRCYINVNGITANNYKADYSIAAYERQIIQAYAGKCSDNTGLLLKIDSGGLTIIGGGESGQNLAGLIDDDQTTESPARLDIDNSQGDTTKETTALLGNSEHLILASDGNIYFVTKCNNTNAPNRIGVCLSNERVFYPMRDNTGSIGSSNYKWQYGYFGQVYGTGGSGKWKAARDKASFINSTPPNENAYAPAIDLKTTSGDWSIGTLDSDENLYFAYVADSIYSGSTNVVRKYNLQAPSTPDSNTYDILHSGNTSFSRTLSSGTKIGTITINGTDTVLYCQTNTNTTYTFADGTNGFTVTPSGGTAQTVTVTPSIANNITGSGTSGYLAKFNGTHTITSGPQLGSGTTTYLRNDGAWKTPTNTKNTAGSTNSTSTLYLIGAESQAANPQTYSSQYIRIESASLAIGDTGTQGAITLYDGTSIQNRWGILKQASGVSGTVTHELPTTGGTILNSSNYDSYAATITIFTKVGTLSPGAGQYYPFTLDPEALKFKIPSKAKILEFFYGNSNGENYSSLKIPVSTLQSHDTTLVTFFLIGDKNQYHTYIRKRTYKITKNNETTFTLEPNYEQGHDNYNHGTTTDLTTSTIGTSVQGTFTISQSDNSIVLCEPKIISYNAP